MALISIGEYKLVQAQVDALIPFLNRTMSGEVKMRSKARYEAEAMVALKDAGVPIATDSVLVLEASCSKPEHLLEEVESALSQKPASIQFHGYEDKDLIEAMNKVLAAGVKALVVDQWSGCKPLAKP